MDAKTVQPLICSDFALFSAAVNVAVSLGFVNPTAVVLPSTFRIATSTSGPTEVMTLVRLGVTT